MRLVVLAVYIFLVAAGRVKASKAAQDVKAYGTEDKRLDRIEGLMIEYIDRIKYLENRVNIQNNAMQGLQQSVQRLEVANNECQKQTLYLKQQISGRDETKHKMKEDRRLLIRGTASPLPKRSTSFYAYMKSKEPNPGIHHTFVFDVVKVNVNGGYNPITGAFTAPEEGVFVFTFSLRARSDSHEMRSYGIYEIVKNSIVENVVIFNNQHTYVEDQVTGTVVLILNQGDIVFVRSHSTFAHSGAIYSDAHGYSSFAGWLISK